MGNLKIKLIEQIILDQQQPKYYKDLGYEKLRSGVPTLNTDVQDVDGKFWRLKPQSVRPTVLELLR